MLQDFVYVKKLPQNAKLYRFEKIPKEINDIHISMTASMITLRNILVNIKNYVYYTTMNKYEHVRPNTQWIATT